MAEATNPMDYVLIPGTTISHATTEGGEYSLLAGIKGVAELPSVTVELYEIKRVDVDPADNPVPSVPTFWKVGALAFKLGFKKDGGAQVGVVAGLAGKENWFKIGLPTGEAFTFKGILAKYGMAVEAETEIVQDVSVQALTKPKYVAAVPASSGV